MPPLPLCGRTWAECLLLAQSGHRPVRGAARRSEYEPRSGQPLVPTYDSLALEPIRGYRRCDSSRCSNRAQDPSVAPLTQPHEDQMTILDHKTTELSETKASGGIS
jgi:hypothetical protein